MSRMRDIAPGATWASYVRAARSHAGLSVTKLAELAKVGRATIYRWETGAARPERAEIVARVAQVCGVDLEEALTAAGFRPGEKALDHPQGQAPPVPESVRYVLDRLADPNVHEREKRMIRTWLDMVAHAARIGAEEEERRAS